jgi:peptide/nickel transport system permease protein
MRAGSAALPGQAWRGAKSAASSGLTRYIVRRVALTILTLWLITVTVFVMTNVLPGNPALVRLGGVASEEALQAEEQRMGLDRPLLERYVDFVGGAIQGDLGTAYATERPVADDLAERFPATLELALFATVLAMVVGIPLGFLAAVKRDSKLDHAVRNLAGVSAAMPVFWLGLMLAYVFAFQLSWAPGPVGRIGLEEQPPPDATGFYTIDSLIAGDFDLFKSSVAHLLLPAITLAFIVLAPLLKMSRSALLEVLQSDYVRTARAMGFSGWQVFRGDALRNALIPILTTLGIVLGYLVAGSVVVEFIYSWPGIGRYVFGAVGSNDFNAVQGFVLTIATVYLLLNLLIDILYAVIDPRIRLAS